MKKITHGINAIFSFILLCALIIYSSGCKKEIHENNSISITNVPAKNGPIPPYLFNWETATYMPPPATATANQVLLPWNSGSSAIDPNIVNDYKSVDGWSMVFNTFTPTTVLGDPNYTYFFTLYNRFRGLLRFYLWQPASTAATSYVNHGLSLYTVNKTSSMLNFCAKDIVDPSTNQATFSQILKGQIQSAEGTWFVYQYEIAYDPNVKNLEFTDLGLEWTSQWANVTNIVLNGIQTGTITGYIGDPAAGQFNFGSLLTQGASTFLGSAYNSTLISVLDAGANPNAVGSTAPYNDALNNALGGIVKGFFSAILGTNNNNTQTVNLSINTKMNLTGNMVSNGGIEDKKLVLPGQLNSQTANGLTPGYDAIMGVFNISNKPTVNGSLNWYTVTFDDPYGGGSISYQMKEISYALDPNSYSLIWNPAVVNSNSDGVTIQNLKTQIVLLSGYAFYTTSPAENPNTGGDGPNGLLVDGTGTIETVGNFSVAASIPNSTTPISIDSSEGWDYANLGVRVTFDVVPNNGSPTNKTTITKTFLANVITH